MKRQNTIYGRTKDGNTALNNSFLNQIKNTFFINEKGVFIYSNDSELDSCNRFYFINDSKCQNIGFFLRRSFCINSDDRLCV